MSNDWCTIESDPAVFTELIDNFGVTNTAVEEIYSLDDIPESRSHGFIFLFKWRSETDSRPIASDEESAGIFFARQTIQNACATQAILSVLFNTPALDLGEALTGFKEFTADFDPETKGIAISNSDVIRTAHNSFARPEVFVSDDEKYSKKGGKSEEVYHFIAYIPFNGCVFELDGLKPGPINLGAGESWVDIARPAIEERMARYSASETAFTLLSVCEKKEVGLRRQLTALHLQMEAAHEEGDREQLTMEMSVVQAELDQEAQKLQRQKQENVRRKHNYLQFTMSLLQGLAKSGKLTDMIEASKTRKANLVAAMTEKTA